MDTLMPIRWFLPFGSLPRFAWLVLVAAFGLVLSAETPVRPNIVLFLADDLGAHDLPCYGADFHETPHLDALARDGLRFTQAYSPSPVCSPTRAALLTGNHPARLRLTIWSEGSRQGPTNRILLQAESRHDLPRTEITLARHLQASGYLTALVGKWHLGDADHSPEVHGFDLNIGGTHWGAPVSYFFPYRGLTRSGTEFRYVPHLELGSPDEYLTDRLTDEALRVMDYAAEHQRPFFLLVAHHAPHTPLQAPKADIAYFESRLKPGLVHRNPVYAAMIRSLDTSVGRVRKRLQELGLDTRTVVLFASDNGGYLGTDASQTIPVTTNAPLRSGKGTLYEGGVRVPLLVRWPGITPAAATCDQPVVLTDLFPTLLSAAGVSLSELPPDGIDLGPVLRNPTARLERDTLYFHYPHYYHAPPSAPASAIRVGSWKLIEHLEDSRVELFDLEQDPSETRNLAVAEPQRAADLRRRLEAWRQSVRAALPRQNPAYVPPRP